MARSRAFKLQILTLVLLGLGVMSGAVSLAQKTLTVCPQGPPACDFNLIREAIDAAQLGDTIQVSPSIYPEDLTIEGKESLTLQGAGLGETILLGSITIKTSEGITVQGFTIQGGTHGVEIQDSGSASMIILQDNRVRGSLGKGINLVKSNAKLLRNVVEEHPAQGISISDSKVLLFQNTIMRNSGAGLTIETAREQSSAILAGNVISKNKGDGLTVSASAADLRPSKENPNKIRENQGCGILAEKGAILTGEGIIARNGKNGEENLCGDVPLALAANIKRVPQDFPTIQAAINAIPEDPIILISPGIYRENLLIQTGSLELRGQGRDQVTLLAVNTKLPTITIQNAQWALIQGLAISGGLKGIKIGGTVQVSLQDLRISRNRSAGIVVGGSAQVSLRAVQVTSNEDQGLSLKEFAQVVLQDSQVFGNRATALLLESAAIIAIQGSQITDNHGNGLTVADSAQASLLNTQVSGNTGNGIEIDPSAAASILNSQILSNRGDGILVWGFAEIQGNKIQGNQGCGVYAKGRARVKGSDNTISDNKYDLCPTNFPWPPNFRK